MKKLVLISLLFLSISINNVFASDSKGAENFVNQSVIKAGKITSNTKLSAEQQGEQINNLLEEIVDLNWVARFILGKNWKTVTEEQRKTFIKLYKEFLINSYSPYFSGYTADNLKIINTEDKENNVYFVNSNFTKKDGVVAKVVFRITYKENRYYVTDIIAEGISFISTLRSDVSSAISNIGMDGFLKDLEQRVKK